MSFAKVLGQPRAAKILSRFLETKRVPSAMLFTGPSGTGKSLMAREFAKALLCADARACGLCPSCVSIDKGIHPDVKDVGARYQASLLEEEEAKQKTLRAKTIRHLRRDMELQSLLGSWKVAIVSDAHTLEVEAANALLKILEEPPEKTLWILLTDRREKLIKTVLSRCFTVLFSPLPARVVEKILLQKGLDASRAAFLSELSEGRADRALELSANPEAVTLRSLTQDPLAAMALADSLPKELYLARAQAQAAISGLSEELRLKHLQGGAEFSQVDAPLRKLLWLQRALSSNADPRLVLSLAGEAAKDS